MSRNGPNRYNRCPIVQVSIGKKKQKRWEKSKKSSWARFDKNLKIALTIECKNSLKLMSALFTSH